MVTSIIAIGIFQIPTLVRLTRGSANAIWAREFVLATRQKDPAALRATGRIVFGEDLWRGVDPSDIARTE